MLKAFALGLFPNFIKNIFEETAWRGYLAPKVYSLGLNGYAGHLIVGIVWGAWHIPYYLFFLDRAFLREFTTLSLMAFVPLVILVIISWAIVYGEILLLTNSIWPAVLMHAVEDAFLMPLFVNHHILIQPGKDWLISPMSGVINIIFFLIIGVGLHQLRKRKIQFSEK
jgi:membrane protease YdiL (CAAX protease family)